MNHPAYQRGEVVFPPFAPDRQEGKVRSLDRPCRKFYRIPIIIIPIVTMTNHIIKVRKGQIRCRVVQPLRYGVHAQPSRAWLTSRRRRHLPVALHIRLSAAEGDSERLRHLRVPVGGTACCMFSEG